MSVQQRDYDAEWQRIEAAYRDGCALLDVLDELGLDLPAAHLSMALDLIREVHPALARFEPDM